MRNEKLRGKVFLLIGLIVLVGMARGAEVRIPVSDVATITSDTQPRESRVLMKFESPEIPQGSRIDIVVIHFRLVADTDSSQVFALQAFPVTSLWNKADANWTRGWENAGGDYDTSVEEFGVLDKQRSDELYFDITRIFRKWLSGEISNNGIILIGTDEKVENLSVLPVANLKEGVVAEVQILYTLPEIER